MKKKLIFLFIIIFLTQLILPVEKLQICEASNKTYYQDFSCYKDGMLAVKRGGKWGFVNSKGVEIVKCKYEIVRDFFDGYAAVYRNDKWGFVNTAGKEVIKCQYYQVGNFTNGLATIRFKNTGLYTGLINKSGKEVIKRSKEYIDAMFVSDNLIAVSQGSWGFIDKKGKVLSKCQFDFIDFHYGFQGGLLQVDKDYKTGFVNTSGKLVIPCKYSVAGNCGEGMVPVKKSDGKWVFFDKTGKEVLKLKKSYQFVYGFSEGLAEVRDKNDNCGYIDKTGKEVIPCSYSLADDFHDGLAKVTMGSFETGHRYGFIDKSGNEVLKCEFDSIGELKDGLINACKSDKYGFYNKQGEEVIESKYDYAYAFSEGMAGVNIDGKWGFIDTTGNLVVKNKYDNISDFHDGVAAVAVLKKYIALVDKNGKEILKVLGNYQNQFSPGYY